MDVILGLTRPASQSRRTAPFYFLLALQLLLCTTRFVCGDAWGGLVMGIVACMGYLAVMGSTIEVIYLAYYGVMVTINGVFDVMVVAEHYHRGYLHFDGYGSKIPLKQLGSTVVVLISPLIEFLSGYFAYRLFKEAEFSECQPILVDDPRDSFRPFQGLPHKLYDKERV